MYMNFQKYLRIWNFSWIQKTFTVLEECSHIQKNHGFKKCLSIWKMIKKLKYFCAFIFCKLKIKKANLKKCSRAKNAHQFKNVHEFKIVINLKILGISKYDHGFRKCS